jgi:hypothetical protein
MLGDAIAVGLAVAIYECVATTICGLIAGLHYFASGQFGKAHAEECSKQIDEAHEPLEPAQASDEYEGSLTRVVLALRSSSSSQIFLRRGDVATLVDKLTSSDHHQFSSPRLQKRLSLIDGPLSSLAAAQAAGDTLYTGTLSSSSQHDDASSMCSSVRSSDRGRKEYSSSGSNYSDEQHAVHTPQQAVHRRASSSADTVLTESSETPHRVSMGQRPRRASSVATDADGAAESQEQQQQQAPATPSVAQVATAVASARALARMRAAAAETAGSSGSPSSAAATTTRKRVSYSAPRKSAPDDAQGEDEYDDYWL